MMQRALRLSAVVVMGFSAALLCSCAGLNPVERMMWSTYPLATEKGMGTAFVVQSPGAAPIIVTSVHVLATMGRGPLMLGTRVPDARGEPEVAILRLHPERGRRHEYVRHPRQDVAAFALELSGEVSDLLSIGSYLDERSIASGPGSLRAGAEVSFLGYPEVLPGTAGAFPILRTGSVASYPLGTSAADGLFVVNADVYPGDSGAPVFVTGSSGRPRLVGMIVRRIGTDEGKFSHMAIAVEASAIRDTVRLAQGRAGDPGPSPARPRVSRKR